MERRRARAYLIRRALEIRKWKATDLARAVGRDGNTVRRWANGTTAPSGDDMVHLAEVFGIDPNEIFRPPAPPEYPLDDALRRAFQAGLQSGRQQYQAEQEEEKRPRSPQLHEPRTVE